MILSVRSHGDCIIIGDQRVRRHGAHQRDLLPACIGGTLLEQTQRKFRTDHDQKFNATKNLDTSLHQRQLGRSSGGNRDDNGENGRWLSLLVVTLRWGPPFLLYSRRLRCIEHLPNLPQERV
jgi:hypothetical protein